MIFIPRRVPRPHPRLLLPEPLRSPHDPAVDGGPRSASLWRTARRPLRKSVHRSRGRVGPERL